jgi:hypothetical protein
MADWQMQCCGEPFSVGATVEWTLAPIGDRGAIAEGQAKCLSRLRESATATPVRSAGGREAVNQDGARFVGYLIELDAL